MMFTFIIHLLLCALQTRHTNILQQQELLSAELWD